LTKIIYVEVKVPERTSDVVFAEVVGLRAVEVGVGLGAPLEGGLAL
jgi:hypothetical protein